MRTAHGAINLAQGFPNFPCPDVLKEDATIYEGTSNMQLNTIAKLLLK